MAGYRFRLDLFVPKSVYDGISSDIKINIRDKIRKLKTYAVKINEGKINEEITVKASYHICHHDDPEPREPCEPEEDI